MDVLCSLSDNIKHKRIFISELKEKAVTFLEASDEMLADQVPKTNDMIQNPEDGDCTIG